MGMNNILNGSIFYFCLINVMENGKDRLQNLKCNADVHKFDPFYEMMCSKHLNYVKNVKNIFSQPTRPVQHVYLVLLLTSSILNVRGFKVAFTFIAAKYTSHTAQLIHLTDTDSQTSIFNLIISPIQLIT